jgi:hypothetical protein
VLFRNSGSCITTSAINQNHFVGPRSYSAHDGGSNHFRLINRRYDD